MLKTVSRKTEVQQSLETDLFIIMYAFKHEDGQVPEMITARVSMKDQDLKKGENPCRVDVSYYPSNGNLQITVHNKPASFDVTMLEEVITPLDDIIASAGE